MIWDELLKLLPHRGRSSVDEAFTELRGRLTGLYSQLLKATSAQRIDPSQRENDRQALVDALTGKELTSSVIKLHALLPNRFQSSFTQFRNQLDGFTQQIVNGIATAATPTEPILADANGQLAGLVASAAGLHEMVSRDKRRRRLVVTLFTYVPFATVLVSTLYLALRNGMTLASAEVHFPYSVSTDKPGYDVTLSMPLQNRYAFMDQFSRFYFDKPNAFAELLFEQANEKSNRDVQIVDHTSGPGPQSKPDPICRVKFDLAEQSQIYSHFISAVDIKVTFAEARRFPWHLLEATPQFNIQFGETGLSLYNSGIGPAVDVTCRLVTESGLVILSSSEPLVTTSMIVPLPGAAAPMEVVYCPLAVTKPSRQFYRFDENERERVLPEIRPTQGTDGFLLATPMYYALEREPEQDDLKRYFEHDDRWYEIVWTVKRLSEITTVSWCERLRAEVHYECLRGVRRCQEQIFEGLPRGVFVSRKPGLGPHDPRIPRPVPPAAMAAAPSALLPLLDRLAPLFALPEGNDEGVSHITLSTDVDVRKLNEHDSAGTVVMVDQSLKKRGTISLYVKLKGVRTGLYRLAVSVNGTECGGITVETLVPERLRFSSSSDVKWLKDYFLDRYDERPERPRGGIMLRLPIDPEFTQPEAPPAEAPAPAPAPKA